MADRISRARRSWNMSRIRSKNTGPEVLVRSLLHRSGIRFRLHSAGVPGRPDVVLKSRRIAIFVHGCFWHRHAGCKYAYTPKSRLEFWRTKFDCNVRRDRLTRRRLVRDGWKVLVVWECETRDLERVGRQLLEAIRAVEISKQSTHKGG